ncbi:MAG: hypothetical protein ABW166_03560 [Sedimenticola sp.]
MTYNQSGGSSLGTFLVQINGNNPNSGDAVDWLILGAGDYNLVTSGAYMPLGGQYTIDFSASPVPVPGAAILFGSAVMAFGFISRRRKGMLA